MQLILFSVPFVQNNNTRNSILLHLFIFVKICNITNFYISFFNIDVYTCLSVITYSLQIYQSLHSKYLLLIYILIIKVILRKRLERVANKMRISLLHDPGVIHLPIAQVQFQLLACSNLEVMLSTSSYPPKNISTRVKGISGHCRCY